MLQSTIILDDKSGDDVTYTQTLFPQGNGTRRIVKTRPLDLPQELIIQHTEAKRTGEVDRRVVSFRQTELDSKGVKQTAVINISFQVPRSDAITVAMIQDLMANAVDFFTDGAVTSVTAMDNLEGILRGEA